MLDEGGFTSYQDPRLQPPDEPEPWEGRTCRECRFSCQAYVPGKGCEGPWLCLFEAMDDPAGHASVVVIDPDDEACEGYED